MSDWIIWIVLSLPILWAANYFFKRLLDTIFNASDYQETLENLSK